MTLNYYKDRIAREYGIFIKKDIDSWEAFLAHLTVCQLPVMSIVSIHEELYNKASYMHAKSVAKVGIDALHNIMVMSASIGTDMALFTESDILKDASAATKKLMSV